MLDRDSSPRHRSKRPGRLLALLTGLIAVVGVFFLPVAGTARSSGAALPAARHVFVVMMENTDWASVLASGSFAYVNGTLVRNYASADNYRTGLHPSLPNYVELEAGATLGLTSGSYLPTDHPVSTTAHLTSQLNDAGLNWKYYAENLPGNGTTCNLTDVGTPYSEDHNPFAYFTDVQGNTDYCIQHERPYTELATDLSSGTVPDYSFIVPNDWDQGEKLAPGSNCARCQADDFLKAEIPKIQASAAYQDGGIILVLWDESASTTTNPSGLIVVSKLAKTGYVSHLAYSHGSTLRTEQEIFGLTPFLGDAAAATDLSDLFAQSPFPGGGTSAPVASFTAAPTSGTAPLAVSFTDTSTGGPTSWAWDFGDGGTSATQNPSHTYSSAGTYRATLTASSAGGSNTTATATTITVGAPPSAGGTVTAGASTKGTGSSATTAIALAGPTGLVDGDVLVASINADKNPTLTMPTGWSQVTGPLTPSGSQRVFSAYHVVSSAAAEPASYRFTLSSAQKWNGGITDFHGVSTTAPFDSTAATKLSTSTVSSVAVPGVTTVTPGAMLIGGAGLNHTTATVKPPLGWTEAWEGDGGQDIDFAYKALPTAGASGVSTFTFSTSTGAAGWVRALKPR
jgi:phosphatidylinositol-3-phosphatase